MSESNETYHFAILGLAAVGKSCITLQYVTNKFVAEYNNTLEDKFTKLENLDDIPCSIEILDTSGEEDFQPLRQLWMRSRDGLIFVFSLTDPKSLEELRNFYAILENIDSDRKIPLVIVGNKNDLPFSKETSSSALQFAIECKAEYIEVSAKSGNNIDLVFHSLVRTIRREQEKQKPISLKKPSSRVSKKEEKKKGFFDFCCLL